MNVGCVLDCDKVPVSDGITFGSSNDYVRHSSVRHVVNRSSRVL